MKSPIEIYINGKLFDKGWSQIHVTRSMDRICSNYTFQCTQTNPFDYKKWEIKMGAPCKVLILGVSIIVGYIEDIHIDYNHSAHTVSISGRDRTCDIVDCTRAPMDENRKALAACISARVPVLQIITALCEPYKIGVTVAANAKQAAQFIFPSITAFDAATPIIEFITKCCKVAQLLPIATHDGNLLLATAGTSTAKTNIVAGYNVLTGALKHSNKDVYSDYMVKGVAPGVDYSALKDAQWMHPVHDNNELAGRYRPLCTLNEVPGDIGDGTHREEWEMRYRSANARSFTYKVQGLTQSDGSPWLLNMNIKVTDAWFGLKGTEEMIINQIEYSVSSETGTSTVLHVCSKAKYDAQIGLDKVKTVFDSLYAK